ncbi:MAG: histidine ammonia-lyase [Clostridiaceae bacterium]|nr:histidine ammonia-lyase [Clostridiaceae bacterium]
MSVMLDGRGLTLAQVVSVARGNERTELTEGACAAVDRAREYVERKLAEGAVIYGLTTGFGKFSDVRISPEETAHLQRNLILSHACAMGEPLPAEAVRAAMLLRCNALARGNSGIRRSTLQALLNMLNAGVHPVVPEQGSLGASGDLAPLAHIVLVLLGEGEAEYRGERLPGAEAMRRAGIPTVELAAKEGLALINGTQIMTAVGALAAWDGLNLLKTADIAAAMTTQAQLGITSAFDEKVQALRGHPGQIQSAANLRKLLDGSSLSCFARPGRVQDAYSVRCVPQIHGASRDALFFVADALGRELNAVTDNPLIFPEEDQVISGGNFHGQPMALAFDFMGIALSELADVSERRLERMVNPQLSYDLPAFLTKDGGVNSGLMIVQYAAASIVSENKVLAHPASVDSIPSSANQEDHVSMGTTAARKARRILANTQKVLALELLTAAQALWMRGPEKLSPATKAVYDRIRSEIPPIGHDVMMYPLENAAEALVSSGELVRAAESVCGALT